MCKTCTDMQRAIGNPNYKCIGCTDKDRLDYIVLQFTPIEPKSFWLGFAKCFGSFIGIITAIVLAIRWWLV